MAMTGKEKLAAALSAAKESEVANIVNSNSLDDKDRTLLVKEGFLKKIIKGWYLLDADVLTENTGESALWFESIWAFINQYITEKFGAEYWLSPELSIDLHTSNNALPKQIVAYVPGSSPRTVNLPNDMSLLIMSSKMNPYKVDLYKDNIRAHTLESALAESVPMAYKSNPLSLQLALNSADHSEVQKALLHNRNVLSGNRICGAYQELGLKVEARNLLTVLKSAGFDGVKPENPFDVKPFSIGGSRTEAPSAKRVRALWQVMREDVLEAFEGLEPKYDFFARDLGGTLADIKSIYVNDAYNSLSIEGYKVTKDLIEKVSNGDWSPETVTKDREQKDALAARGYYDAFNKVKELLEEAHDEGAKPDLNYLVGVGIIEWYTALFRPCVTAGIIEEADLAGYRKGPIYIKTSMHVPPPSEALMDCMDVLKALIAEEPNYAVKAVLAQLFVGYIHAFPDGNGRTARFLMNFLFVLGGYDWVVIKHRERMRYLESLESASVGGNVKPFANFIRHSMLSSEE